jgi:hypothetical protein
MDIQEILQDLGYQLRSDTNGWRTSALYRGGDNPTSLKINKDGSFFDFVTSQTGDFTKLVGLTTGTNPANYLSNKKFEILPEESKTLIDQPSFFEKPDLIPEYFYPEKRKISRETCQKFESGVGKSGKMAGRYVFPIKNLYGKINGLAGRALFQTDMKWKILGKKRFFLFPLFLNSEVIKEKGEVILVESIFDCLSLWESNVKNSFVLFGLTISPFQVTSLAKLGVSNVKICLNNDFRGFSASEKLHINLSRYFDKKKVKIVQPKENDWSEELVNNGTRSIYGKLYN